MPPAPPAPELSGRGGWLGVPGPLTMAALRGRVVIVAFWDGAEVASLRVLEELRRLDHVHGEELVVVAVHWPRSPGAAGSGALARTVARCRITAPVLDDPDGTTAAAFGVADRPALVLVAPDGSVVGTRTGEGHGRSLGRAVAELVAAADPDLPPLPVLLAAPVPEPLAFPARVAASDDGTRLAIADTGHDRVLVTTVEGLVLGAFTGYLQPSAVRFDGRRVLVCDSVPGRAVWSDGEVLADGMAWPADVVAAGDGSWVVAEAGGHRLVRLRPGEIAVRVAAGSGSRGLVDGPDLRAELDQPTALARDGDGVLFVDGGTGSLRRLRAGRRGGEVVTVADGLQQARAVATRPGCATVYLAGAGASGVLAWDGADFAPVTAEGLLEPGGVDLLPDGRLVVADTGNHRVVVVDPVAGTTTPLVIDETWAHAAGGDPVALAAGSPGDVPVLIELVDEELATPARVIVSAQPADLLAGGETVVADVTASTGAVTVRGGRPGQGLLLVEVHAAARAGARRSERVQRRRHRLVVGGP